MNKLYQSIESEMVAFQTCRTDVLWYFIADWVSSFLGNIVSGLCVGSSATI